jgi:hypothetical protein
MGIGGAAFENRERRAFTHGVIAGKEKLGITDLLAGWLTKARLPGRQTRAWRLLYVDESR